MQGINAYQLPRGLPADAQVVDVGGLGYIFSPSTGLFANLQAVSAKFKDYEDLDKYMTDTKGVTSWLRPSQST